jgi:hypothetical protein
MTRKREKNDTTRGRKDKKCERVHAYTVHTNKFCFHAETEFITTIQKAL